MNDKDADLEAEVHRLRAELWTARDAAIGATAELGATRAKIKELDSLIHQLRLELRRHEQEAGAAQRVVRVAARPLRAAKRRFSEFRAPRSDT